jgi:hypothetical protein
MPTVNHTSQPHVTDALTLKLLQLLTCQDLLPSMSSLMLKYDIYKKVVYNV